MTVNNAKQTPFVRRPLPLGALAAGLAAGLYAAGAAALPASTVIAGMGQSATGALADPAKRTPDAVTVSAIDFKRGDGGSGKLILRFDGAGAAPDLRNAGGSVVVDIGNAQLPAALQRPVEIVAADLGPEHRAAGGHPGAQKGVAAALRQRFGAEAL